MTPPWSDAVDGSLGPLPARTHTRYPVAPTAHGPDGRISSDGSTPREPRLFPGPPTTLVPYAAHGLAQAGQRARRGGEPDVGPRAGARHVHRPAAARAGHSQPHGARRVAVLRLRPGHARRRHAVVGTQALADPLG